jgi:hypothetical protein
MTTLDNLSNLHNTSRLRGSRLSKFQDFKPSIKPSSSKPSRPQAVKTSSFKPSRPQASSRQDLKLQAVKTSSFKPSRPTLKTSTPQDPSQVLSRLNLKFRSFKPSRPSLKTFNSKFKAAKLFKTAAPVVKVPNFKTLNPKNDAPYRPLRPQCDTAKDQKSLKDQDQPGL